MSVDSGAGFNTAGADEVITAAETAVAQSHAGIAALHSGEIDGLARLEAYDAARQVLVDTAARAHLFAQTHPDPAVRAAAETAEQLDSAALAELNLDQGVYHALAALGTVDTDPSTHHYLARVLRDFRRAGVDRDDSTRQRIRELREDLVRIEQEFQSAIRADVRTTSFAPSALIGLPVDYIRARAPGDDGRVHISTDFPDILPVLTYCRDGSVRETMWRLFRQRGYPSNVATLRAMLERRHELATLLGYPYWAQYEAEGKMVGSADGIRQFLESIATASDARAAMEYGRLLARKRLDEPSATTVWPWDTMYLNDRLKAEAMSFDTQAMRPYFEYEQVKAGVMNLVGKLFGVRYQTRSDIPVWHPDVECFDVLDRTERIGRIFLDMHPRPNKFNHAAMFPLTTGRKGGPVPECALVCNLPRPSAEPALLMPSDVKTFLHEFGHLVHHVLSGTGRWAGINGLAMEWDFVEAPSQLLEEWMLDAETLADFAVHNVTGEPLPAEMVAAMRAAEEFGKGLQVRQQLYYAALSYGLHAEDPARFDPLSVEHATYARYLPYPYVDDVWTHLSFGHLASYSALYYSYTWSLVIAKDLLSVFAREGMRAPEVAQRYQQTILARGGGAPAAELVASFLGRPYSFDAFRGWLDTS